jgi:lipopolysaccharide/colanic/teichoic acid biosynthesis glycosyltransferase
VTAKRIVDVCIAMIGIVLLSPFLILIAIAVRLSSPGPIIYRQERIGLHGRPFRILKFRSMVVDADRLAGNVSPVGDTRVTRVGAFLRRCYLDELPQLFNVLKGDMSLVGPRPETPEFVARYSSDEARILTVRPGLAGPSTLAFMDEAERLADADDPETYYVDTMMHERARLDLEYLTHRSLAYDAMVLVRQFVAILRKVLS